MLAKPAYARFDDMAALRQALAGIEGVAAAHAAPASEPQWEDAPTLTMDVGAFRRAGVEPMPSDETTQVVAPEGARRARSIPDEP
jgi:hypothetical protein